MAVITKQDIKTATGKFTTNISDEAIAVHITRAIDIDFFDVIPVALVDKIKSFSLTDNGNDEMKSFYNTYLKELWCYRAYARFLANHGTNITQFGVSKTTDINSENVDDKERGRLIAAYERDASVMQIQMLNYLLSINYTIDGISYIQTENRGKITTKHFGIRAIK